MTRRPSMCNTEGSDDLSNHQGDGYFIVAQDCTCPGPKCITKLGLRLSYYMYTVDNNSAQ